MRSVRLNDELESRLEQASEASGQPASDIIREGVRRRCDEILARSAREELAEFIGCLASGRGRGAAQRRAATSARRTGEAFAELLEAKRPRRKRASKRARG